MTFIDIINIIWRCVGILLLTAETVFIALSCIGVPLIWGKLDKIDGALRCIDIDLAAFLRDERKSGGTKDDEH